MADWYVGSVQYTAVTQWAALTATTVGTIRRQLAAPAAGNERCFRCSAITTGITGAAEPTWNLTKAATTTDAGVTWTEVTGNSTYNWTAPASRLNLMTNSGWSAAGDTVYIASNSAETRAAATSITPTGTAILPLNVYCVNAAGGVPPVAADFTTGASVNTTGASNINVDPFINIWGVAFNCGDGANNGNFVTGSGVGGILSLTNCAIKLNTTLASAAIYFGLNGPTYPTLTNVTMEFGATGQTIQKRLGTLAWYNTASAILGTVPTTLFNSSAIGIGDVLCDGIDFSAAGSGKTIVGGQAAAPSNFSLVNCKFGASVTRYAAVSARIGATADLLISDSTGTTYNAERNHYEGVLTAETTFVMSGGASDGVTPISWKIVSTANALRNNPFVCPPIAKWNTVVGTPVTITVELESNATLTDADCWLEVEYLGSSATPISTLVSSAPATPLTTPANLSTSTVTWSGGLGSAVKQKMSVTFTPQLAGLIRGVVKVGKASQTLYINPVLN